MPHLVAGTRHGGPTGSWGREQAAP